MIDGPIKVDTGEARQGQSGLGVRYVLTIGLALIIAAGIIIYLFVR